MVLLLILFISESFYNGVTQLKYASHGTHHIDTQFLSIITQPCK
jgi:hypothetical protein